MRPVQFRKAVCIFNPASGRRTLKSRAREVEAVLARSVGSVELRATGSPGHAGQLARGAADRGCDLVACLSGDGTVNEAVQALAGTQSPALLVLPGGTANVLVHEIGLPLQSAAAAAMLPTLTPATVRLGEVHFESTATTRYFLLMCGAGLDAAIAMRVSTELKRRLGQGAYWVSAASQCLRRFPKLRAIADRDAQPDRSCCLAVVSKSRMYGGRLVFTPGAHLLAEDLEASEVIGSSRLLCGSYLVAAALRSPQLWPGVRLRRCRELRLVPDGPVPVPVQVDGEVAGFLPARVSLSRAACTLLVPPEYVNSNRHEGRRSRQGHFDQR